METDATVPDDLFDYDHLQIALRPKDKNLKQPDVITREMWYASSISGSIPKLEMPINKVILTYTGSVQCRTVTACKLLVHVLQRGHMKAGMFDIPYNFLVTSDSTVIEGRGWLYKPRLTSKLRKEGNTLVIARIIDKAESLNESLKTIMDIGAFKVIDYGIRNKYIERTFQLFDSPALELLK